MLGKYRKSPNIPTNRAAFRGKLFFGLHTENIDNIFSPAALYARPVASSSIQ